MTPGFRICDLDDIEADEMILDIGPKTSKMLAEYLKDAKTIIWNGPVGVFEMDNFKEGTRDLAEKVAEATANGAFTIVGGGDTIARRKPLRWQIKFLISLQAAVPSLNSLKARHCLLSQPFRKELSNSLF